MTSEHPDQSRREMIGGLEDRYQRAKANALKLKDEAAQAERECKDLEAQMRRAQMPLNDTALCNECWVYHADPHVVMVPQPSGYGEDLLRCHRGHERPMKLW